MNQKAFALFFVMLANCVHADSAEIDHALDSHVKADLATLQSFKIFSQAQAGGHIEVGGDAAKGWCDYSTIQEAIDAAARQGITEIRIAYNKTYTENLSINNIDISLIGGYASCQLAGGPFSSPNTNQVSIDGGNDGSVITITGSSTRNTILLKNLQLSNGNSDVGGGISASNESALITLKNVDIRNNTASRGGGMAVLGQDIDMLLLDSRVLLNTARWGGGISCQSDNGASSIVLSGKSGLLANSAVINGGGIRIHNCYFGLYSGSTGSGSVGITSNTAGWNGGGIYVRGGGTVALNGQKYCSGNGTCLGDDINPASIRGNSVGTESNFRTGGGIQAFESTIKINAGFIEGNTAPAAGGGIYLEYSDLIVTRSGKACGNNQRCNMFLGNYTPGVGGAIYAKFESNIDISASFFEQNTAKDGAVIFAWSNLGGSEVRMEGSVVNNNGDSSSESIIYIGSGSGLEVVHSTIADNEVADDLAVDGIIKTVHLFDIDLPGDEELPPLHIYSSIFDNPGFNNLTHNMNGYVVDIVCVIAHEITSLTANFLDNQADDLAGGSFITLADPKFADRNNRNYSLTAASPAIDYCNTPTYAEVRYKDIDFQKRGVDDPDHADNYFLSFFDIGADEAYVGNVIFKSGFE